MFWQWGLAFAGLMFLVLVVFHIAKDSAVIPHMLDPKDPQWVFATTTELSIGSLFFGFDSDGGLCKPVVPLCLGGNAEQGCTERALVPNSECEDLVGIFPFFGWIISIGYGETGDTAKRGRCASFGTGETIFHF